MAVKRLLSIDGGGIRGIIAAEILVEIEEALKEYNPKYQRLSDYFDFISGTSTGSIIAAGLAKGMSAKDILKLYKTEGQKIFTKAKPPQSLEEIPGWTQIEKKIPQALLWIIKNLPWPYKQEQIAKIISLIANNLLTKYSGEQLEKVLQQEFGDITLGSDALKTNLMIVTNNVTRGQTWFFVNNIARKEYKKKNPYLELQGDIPLWQIIRSSAAAPTFFPPYTFKVKLPKPNKSSSTNTPNPEQECEFIDGGISSYNNPSFQLFLEAVHPDYPTGWEAGVDKILLVSIGTGYDYNNIKFGEAKQKNNIEWAGYVIDGLMDQANIQQNQLMELIGKPRKLRESTRPGETGFVALGKEVLSYCRFTISLTVERLKGLADENLLLDDNNQVITADKITPELVKKLNRMDSTSDEYLQYFSAIGKAIAKEQFSLDLFDGFVDAEDGNVNQDSSSNKVPSTVS